MTTEEILQQIRHHSERVRREWPLQHDVESHLNGELVKFCVAILERDAAADPFCCGTQKWARIMDLPYPTALIWCATLLVHEIQRVQSDHEFKS